jgi:hypothetical protein
MLAMLSSPLARYGGHVDLQAHFRIPPRAGLAWRSEPLRLLRWYWTCCSPHDSVLDMLDDVAHLGEKKRTYLEQRCLCSCQQYPGKSVRSDTNGFLAGQSEHQGLLDTVTRLFFFFF